MLSENQLELMDREQIQRNYEDAENWVYHGLKDCLIYELVNMQVLKTVNDAKLEYVKKYPHTFKH